MSNSGYNKRHGSKKQITRYADDKSYPSTITFQGVTPRLSMDGVTRYANTAGVVSGASNASMYKSSQSANITSTSPGFYSPYHTPSAWQIPTNRREVYAWIQYWYDNEAIVATGIDFYSMFTMNGFELECSNGAVKKYFEEMCQTLQMRKWLQYIAKEYFQFGDVFIMTELDCDKCHGQGIDEKTNKYCDHEGARWNKIHILDPNTVEVSPSFQGDDSEISWIPPETLIRVVTTGQPEDQFKQIPEHVRQQIKTKKPIKINPLSITHLKAFSSPYQTFGTSLIRRLFPTLAYRDKLRQAQWLTAERHILPIKVVKVGSEQHMASDEDIQLVQEQLAAVANDPVQTIVTHHAFDFEWIGACHDNQTEVLTNRGFLRFDQVTQEDMIGCYNNETKHIEYHNYQERHEYDYDSDIFGKMYHFTGEETDSCVTRNHRMLVERQTSGWDVVKAEDVSGDDKFLSLDMSSEEFKPVTFSIEEVDYNDKVWCFTVPTGFFVTRRDGKISIHGNSGKVLQVTEEYELINEDLQTGLQLNKALLHGEGPNYASAQVGLDALAKKLNSFRDMIAEWMEQKLFKPIAEFNNFTSKDPRGIETLVIPKVKFNDLNLKDNTAKVQNLLELRKRNEVSLRTILGELGLDYDQEVEQMREEEMGSMIQDSSAGMGVEEGADLGGGGMPPMGGMPPEGMPPEGGEMGGAPPGGAPPEMGAPPPAAGPGAMAAKKQRNNYRYAMKVIESALGDIYNNEYSLPFGTSYRGALDPELIRVENDPEWMPLGRDTTLEEIYAELNNLGNQKFGAKKTEKEEVPKKFFCTGLEGKLFSGLKALNLPPAMFAQYMVGGNPKFKVDAAFPTIKVAVEADGETWHNNPDAINRDRRRDQALAGMGWSVIRFTEDEVKERLPDVVDAVKRVVLERYKGA